MCKEATPVAADTQVTGAVASIANDHPPLPDAKPAEGPSKPSAARPAPKRTQAKSVSAKRIFKREVNRLRRFIND